MSNNEPDYYDMPPEDRKILLRGNNDALNYEVCEPEKTQKPELYRRGYAAGMETNIKHKTWKNLENQRKINE